MFFGEKACYYCQPFSSTLLVILLFLHPLAKMLKCCFCGSNGASMTDFQDLQLKEQLLLQQTHVKCSQQYFDGLVQLCVFVFLLQPFFLLH